MPRVAVLLSLLFTAWGGPAVAADSTPLFRLDHLLLGASDLDQATEQVAAATGVRPLYGGKHPIGTHNALLSLGEDRYLEVIAAQPGLKPFAFGTDFGQLEQPTPIGWAVAVRDVAAARAALEAAGFALTPTVPGSRTTPAGVTLEWQTFGLVDGPAQAPFFIAWAATTAHPATTSPGGCRLASLAFAGPDAQRLQGLLTTLAVDVAATEATGPSMRIELACPVGRVVYSSR